MAEKEVLELNVKFNEKAYLEEGAKVYAQRADVEAAAVKIHNEGYSNIILLGIGGTEFEFAQFEYLLNKKTNIEVIAANAADFNTVRPKKLNKDSVVVTSSASGDTVEIVEAVSKLEEEGIRVVAFTKKTGKLGGIASNVIEAATKTGECEYGYMLNAFFLYKLAQLNGDFDGYDKFADQLEGIYESLVGVKKAWAKRSDEYAKADHNKLYTIFTGSGSLFGETLLFAMCILEEMQWVRTRPLTSAQFFHGTLELIEPGVPVFIIKGEDEYRAQDNRVEAFCKQIGAEHYVFDTKEFAVCVSDEFRELVVPWIVTAALTGYMSIDYEKYTRHNLAYRRYYRQFKY